MVYISLHFRSSLQEHFKAYTTLAGEPIVSFKIHHVMFVKCLNFRENFDTFSINVYVLSVAFGTCAILVFKFTPYTRESFLRCVFFIIFNVNDDAESVFVN